MGKITNEQDYLIDEYGGNTTITITHYADDLPSYECEIIIEDVHTNNVLSIVVNKQKLIKLIKGSK